MKAITILGSTGSIGTQALQVIGKFPNHFKIFALSANTNINLLSRQIKIFSPKIAVVKEKFFAEKLKQKLINTKTKIYYGESALSDLSAAKTNLILIAIVGNAGILPTYIAVKNKNNIALANKESLVSAGEIIIPLAKKNNIKIIPVDSEHNAIFQILQGEDYPKINKIILTASGGPFKNFNFSQLKNVTPEQALKHTNWNMGSKITIDSATLMNKGLEIIEAKFLFNVPLQKIKVLIHPQSIIHSLVEFVDKSLKLQAYFPDMRLPILYALFYPERKEAKFLPSLNLADQNLTFENPDLKKFPCLKLAINSAKAGGTTTCVLNAVNEIVVSAFLQKKISFTDIPLIIERILKKHYIINKPDLKDIFEVDNWARKKAQEIVIKL